ncbi:hypothetical protein [Streptomyces sp. NPDC059468]|uniref:hypothetical protein n=1 Tax=Streptomyces sp. NPDC059468 TaxID=3346845 RepID=UPI0036A370B0
MARTKRTWYTKLLDFLEVDWTCLHRDTRTPKTEWDDPWARFVILKTVTEDGRELHTPLTPAEARKLARRLVMRADFVEDANRQHDNGWTTDAVKEG